MASKTNGLEIKHVFKSQKGVVVGRGHDGMKATTATRNFEAESQEELVKKIKNAFNSNTLDPELIFKEVICAGVEIVDESSVEIDGKVYTNTTIKNKVFGDEEFFNSMLDTGEIIDTCPDVDDIF